MPPSTTVTTGVSVERLDVVEGLLDRTAARMRSEWSGRDLRLVNALINQRAAGGRLQIRAVQIEGTVSCCGAEPRPHRVPDGDVQPGRRRAGRTRPPDDEGDEHTQQRTAPDPRSPIADDVRDACDGAPPASSRDQHTKSSPPPFASPSSPRPATRRSQLRPAPARQRQPRPIGRAARCHSRTSQPRLPLLSA